MAIDLRKAFKGFSGATPDGELPKINDSNCDGVYDFEVVSTSKFLSFNSGTYSFKAEVIILACDNGRFKPGTKASIVVHNILDGNGETKGIKSFTLSKAWGNVKAFLATALASKFEVEITAYDDDCGGDPWEDVIAQALEVEDTCKGGKGRVQTTTVNAQQSGKPFAKMNFMKYESTSKAA